MSQTTSQFQEEKTVPAQKPQRRWGKLRLLIFLALLLLGVGIGVRYYFLGQPEDNDLELSGRIEGYETDIGAKVGGRIEYNENALWFAPSQCRKDDFSRSSRKSA